MPDRPKVYSEQEASDIVRRAAELAEAKAANSYKSGITRDELERIASEMGVPLEALDQAINESSEPTKGKKRFAFNTKVESVLDFEADEDDLGGVLDMVNPMRRHAVVLTGKRLELVTMTGMMRTRVTAHCKNGRTRLTLDGRGFTVFMFTAYPILIFGFQLVALTARYGPAGTIAGSVALVALALAAFWAGMQLSIRKLHELSENIREKMEESHQESTGLRQELGRTSSPLLSQEGQHSEHSVNP
ncbi:MAG: hypothetical protein ABUL72_05060 [Armatimonadota bacterium]